MNLKDEWNRLDAQARAWFLEHPAALVVPPGISARIRADALKDVVADQQGRIVLSAEDHAFIRDKAEAAGTIRAPGGAEYRFFDTASLPRIDQAPETLS